MPEIMITIDDAPHPESTSKLIAAFKQFDLSVAWFVTGIKSQARPDLVKAIVDAGNHRVGNHTMNHRQPFGGLPEATMVEEWKGCHAVVKGITGYDMEILRSPGGAGWLSPQKATVQASIAQVNQDLNLSYKEIKGAGADDNKEPDWAAIKKCSDAGNLADCAAWHAFVAEIDGALRDGIGGNLIFHDTDEPVSAADFMVPILEHIQKTHTLKNFVV